MPAQTRKSPAAHPYAQSLLELANESTSAEPIAQELEGLRQILQQHPAFARYLSDPAIGVVERDQALVRVLGGNIRPLVLNFLRVLNEKKRLAIFDEIIDTYQELLKEQLGKVDVDVIVARKLSEQQLEAVRKRISQALKKDAIMHQSIDDSIIGGLIIRVGDKLIDASARYQLTALRQKLMEAPVPE